MFLKILFLFSFLLRIHSLEKCGIKSNDSSLEWRIVGGHDSSSDAWPWMGSILLRAVPFFKGCGATLISKNWVLTAAHCLYVDTDPSKWSVMFGENQTQVVMNIIKVVLHPKFSIENGVYNDIALLKMNQSLDLNEEHKSLTPICLTNNTRIDLSSAKCVITGWGYPSAKTESSTTLREAVVPIVNSSQCFETFAFKIDINTCICAGGVRSGGLGTCNGDSGGPLQCLMSDNKWTQFGITSWGRACAKPGIPDVFTKISAYYEWIEEIIKT